MPAMWIPLAGKSGTMESNGGKSMQGRDKLYINGEWVASLGEMERLDVENPASERIIGQIPEGTAADVDAAVSAANAMQLKSGQSRRGKSVERFYRKLQQGLSSRYEEMAATICNEVGMPLKLSRHVQVGLPLAVLESYVRLIANYPFRGANRQLTGTEGTGWGDCLYNSMELSPSSGDCQNGTSPCSRVH
jgi:acyl-CoA reductase-like NAD-dependent aldehyde dehydrogenase